MPISNSTGALIRGDINIKVEEAAGAELLLIGSRAMPMVSAAVRAGTYPKIKVAAGELLRAHADVRSRGGSYQEISRQWTTDDYECLDRGLEEGIDDIDNLDFSRFFSLEVATARWVLRNVMLAHEVRVAGQIFSTANFGAATNSAVAYTEANIATISFVKDVLDAIARIKTAAGVLPNTIIIGEAAYNRICRADKVLAWVAGSLKGQSEVNASSIAASFREHGIEQVLVGRSVQNTAAKGQAASLAQIWSNAYVWVGAVNRGAANLEQSALGGAGFTFVWNKEGGLWVTESYRDEKRRQTMVRVRQNTVEKVTDPTSGTLIATQYA